MTQIAGSLAPSAPPSHGGKAISVQFNDNMFPYVPLLQPRVGSVEQWSFINENNARSQRVPYRENRCVLFDSKLFHTTDEIHFKPGYCNRRVNVTLLFGKSLNTD